MRLFGGIKGGPGSFPMGRCGKMVSESWDDENLSGWYTIR